MPRPPFIDFPLDPSLMSALEKCVRPSGDAAPEAEWPGNILSTKTAVYMSGRIAKAGEPVVHQVDPDELEQIKRLAHDALKVMQGVPVGMGSKSPDAFQMFYSAANVDDTRPEKIDAEMIRSRFGGTIFPPATITVEPMVEGGTWWSEVSAASNSSIQLFPWRQMIHWFRTQPDFVDSAFVRIGDIAALRNLSVTDYPAGTIAPGHTLPRLALGLTRAGSLTGLLGCCDLG